MEHISRAADRVVVGCDIINAVVEQIPRLDKDRFAIEIISDPYMFRVTLRFTCPDRDDRGPWEFVTEAPEFVLDEFKLALMLNQCGA